MKVRVDDRYEVSAVLEAPDGFDGTTGLTVVLGHGAGADMESPFMRLFADGLVEAGHAAVRFNFPYKEEGKKAPNPQRVLEATFRAVLGAVREEAGGGPLVIGGKSMGGRMASYLAAADEDVAGLALLGYPLHPAGKPDRRRDAHFPDIRVPTLFLQGERDSLCDLALLRTSLEGFGGRARVHVLTDGDHSFKPRKSSGRTLEQAHAEAQAVLHEWLAEVHSSL